MSKELIKAMKKQRLQRYLQDIYYNQVVTLWFKDFLWFLNGVIYRQLKELNHLFDCHKYLEKTARKSRSSFCVEISAYFKSMQQLSTFKEGVIDIKENINWENLVETNGTGKAYGIEFNLKKNFEKLTTQLSYDYSYSDRRFPEINQGKPYVYDYNRPQNISFQMGRKLNRKWSFNLLWVYQSGTPYTPAIGRKMSISTEPNENGEIYYFETFIYGERNSARMRAYHRLDIAFQYTTTTKKRKMKAIWTFGVYNLYNRRNPNIYYYNNNASNEIYKPDFNGEFKALNLYQLSLFPIIPNISYKVYFNGSDFNKPNKQTLKNWLFFE